MAGQMIRGPGGLGEGSGYLPPSYLLVGCDLVCIQKWSEGEVVLGVAAPELWQDC